METVIEVNLEVSQYNYDSDLLVRWRAGNNLIVPQYVLQWNGPGMKHSYGFGEMLAEKHFRNEGYVVFNNNFDILSLNSKHQKINNALFSIIGLKEVAEFKNCLRDLNLNGNQYKVKQPDLFVFNDNEHFFVEVKKDSDKLNEGQFRFVYIAKQYLNCVTKGIHFYGDNISRKESVSRTMEIKMPMLTE
jgi:hypothetical protein